MSRPGVDEAENKQLIIDFELDHRAKTTCCKISENAHILSNEPSLACYRLQEHVRKSLAPLAERRIQMNDARRDLQGKCYDLEYSISAVRSFQQSAQHLSNVQDLMKNAIFMKQQLIHSEAQTSPAPTKRASKIHRFSGSFDLPNSFLPSGLSTSLSVGSDIKSSPVSLRSTSSSPRRPRTSSVSSSHSSKVLSSTPAK
uniref:Uncharacterized protein n=1 Tax=Ornithodoros turicata TaxID=34597 RepID=A0A2R5LH02_9ACAR